MTSYVDLIWCHTCQRQTDHYRHPLDGLLCDVCDEPALLPAARPLLPVEVVSSAVNVAVVAS